MENGSFQDHFLHNQTGNFSHGARGRNDISIPPYPMPQLCLVFALLSRPQGLGLSRVYSRDPHIHEETRPYGTQPLPSLDGHEFLLEVYAQHLNHRHQVICLCSIDCFNAWMCTNRLHGSTKGEGMLEYQPSLMSTAGTMSRNQTEKKLLTHTRSFISSAT